MLNQITWPDMLMLPSNFLLVIVGSWTSWVLVDNGTFTPGCWLVLLHSWLMAPSILYSRGGNGSGVDQMKSPSIR